MVWNLLIMSQCFESMHVMPCLHQARSIVEVYQRIVGVDPVFCSYMTMMIQRDEDDVDELLQTIFAIYTDRDWQYGFPPTSK